MSTEKAPQDSGSGTDLQAPNIGANTGGNPFLPFDQNQTRQFFEAVTDMKARTMSLTHGRVMKTTFEPLKGQYQHLPRGECQQSEEQPQTSISHHSPRGECQYSNIKCCQETVSLAHGQVMQFLGHTCSCVSSYVRRLPLLLTYKQVT